MGIPIQSSLIDATASSPISDAVDWTTSLLFGSVAVTLCVLAVAFVGLLMLSGRLPIREGLRVVIGCFLLFGAPVIAAAFVGGGELFASAPSSSPSYANDISQENIPPAEYNPYAQAAIQEEP